MSTPPRRVIGIDTWTKAAHHFERLVDPFARKGLDLTLIHLGSWGNDVGRPASEVIGRLPVRDISYYGGRSLPEVIQAEKPCALIFLSMHALGHRAINRYCRYYGIPTIHLFHGLYGATNEADAVTVMLHKRLWALRHHVGKLLFHFIPAYARALWRTGAKPAEWQQFAQELVNRLVGRVRDLAAADSRADVACVYIESDMPRAMARHGYAEEDVIPVGNPDLPQFGVGADDIGLFLRPDFRLGNDVVYVDSGLVDVGLVYATREEFKQHILATHDELRRQGKNLWFKPHPIHLGTPMLAELAAAGVGICLNPDYVASLKRSCACIAEPSSAALIPALLGMPLLLAQYGKLGSRRFGEILLGYPRTRPLTQLRDLPALLAEEQRSLDVSRASAWIGKNTGPLPAEALADRVADAIVQLVQRRKVS